MTQSAHLITSRLCSMTTIECFCFHQPLEKPHQDRDIVKMKASRWFIENEQAPAF